MANPDFGEDFNKRKDTSTGHTDNTSGSMGKVKEKTASWGKLPGKTGPGRGAGVTKLKTFAKADGI